MTTIKTKNTSKPSLALLRAVAKRAGIWSKGGLKYQWITVGGLSSIPLNEWRPDLYAAHVAPLVAKFGLTIIHRMDGFFGYITDGKSFPNQTATVRIQVVKEGSNYTYPAAAWAASVAHHEREKAREKASKKGNRNGKQ